MDRGLYTMQATLLICIFTPLIGAFLLPLIGRRAPRVRNIFALLFVLTAFIGSCALLPAVLAGQKPLVRLALPLGLSLGFQADALAVFMALASSLVASVILVYSFGYIKDYDNQNEYYLMAVLFIGGIQLLVLGIMGEYIGRIYGESKRRPLFLIREERIQKATSAAAADELAE